MILSMHIVVTSEFSDSSLAQRNLDWINKNKNLSSRHSYAPLSHDIKDCDRTKKGCLINQYFYYIWKLKVSNATWTKQKNPVQRFQKKRKKKMERKRKERRGTAGKKGLETNLLFSLYDNIHHDTNSPGHDKLQAKTSLLKPAFKGPLRSGRNKKHCTL